MIITDNQRDYLGARFEQLYQLYQSSHMEFPFGLPGWKALTDMEKMCTKLLRLNRLSPLATSRECAAVQWEHLLVHLAKHDEGEENLVYIVRAIPTIVAKMNAEHVYGA
ncbi:MAG: hypothetical protein IJI38_00905 [Clostridia bacterium]|nr:hypothetical protein [Clostridia bacterium]